MDGLQLDGLSSGMPTQQIIDKLMRYERMPMQSLEKNKSELQTQKDAWRDVNSRLDSLEDKLTQLKLSSTFDSYKATSSDENVVTASASTEAGNGSYVVTVNQLAQKHRVYATNSVVEDNQLTDELTPNDFTGSIDINGSSITVESDETLSSLKTKINEAETGATATIVDGHLVLESNETGDTNSISITDNTTNSLMTELSLDGNLQDDNNSSVLQLAQDAQIDINGISGITSSDNTFDQAVDGVTFNISSSANTNESATITVNRDTESATSAIQGFVDQYNSVMDFITTKTDYDQETDKAGTLQGDTTLSRIQMRVRTLLTDKVDSSGDYNQLATVGITIDRDGVMSFDSGKFTDALESSPEEVKNLFKAESDDAGFDGVATRLDGYLDQLLQSNTGTIPNRMDYYDNQIERVEEDITDLERELENTRQRYVEQFTSMEQSIAKMQQQQSWMMSQLQGMGSSGGTSSLLSSMM